MDVSLVRARIGPAVAAIVTTIHGYDRMPDSVDVPAFFPLEMDLDYKHSDATFSGEPVVFLDCLLLTSHADDQSGQALLDTYLKTTGATSVKVAVETDKTLAGACGTLHMESVQGYRLYTVGANTYYGARIRIKVLA